MRSQIRDLSNFCRSWHSRAECYRPQKEAELVALAYSLNTSDKSWLTRGASLSYNDSCLNDDARIIDTLHFNHLLSFDVKTGVLCCQPACTFADLFSVHPDFIPPVIPGTLQATLAGGIAHDIHGKNNPRMGTLGQHIEWMDLLVGQDVLRISPDLHPQLYQATIGGLGLTGLIKRVALKMQKASSWVAVDAEKYDLATDANWALFLQQLQHQAEHNLYHAAWIDLLNSPRAILTTANPIFRPDAPLKWIKPRFRLPSNRFPLVHRWNMRLFNRWYFASCKTEQRIMPFYQFNNPLDAVGNWNTLYGKAGFLQFQAVFPVQNSADSLASLVDIIQLNAATPTLVVLKYFAQKGAGLLSFAEPGFTIAIDFIPNSGAKAAIQAMNARISELGGKVYLAKDLFLKEDQFHKQYPRYQDFESILQQYPSRIESTLSRRLGLRGAQ